MCMGDSLPVEAYSEAALRRTEKRLSLFFFVFFSSAGLSFYSLL